MVLVGSPSCWLLVGISEIEQGDSYLYSPIHILNGPSEIRPNFRSYFSSVPMGITRK